MSGCRGQERLGNIARTVPYLFRFIPGHRTLLATVTCDMPRAAFDLWRRSSQATSSITSSLPLNVIASPAYLPCNSA
jgi:hypothetical protein